MPSYGEHGEHCRHNLTFLNSFYLSHSNDWAITVMFYTAVHLVESVLDKNHQIHSQKHQERSQHLDKLNGFPKKFYKKLEREAHDSRYKAYKVYDWEVHICFTEYFRPLIQWFNQNQTVIQLDLDPCSRKDMEWFGRYRAHDPECSQAH